MDRVREMVRLRRMGCSTREVSRLLRMGPNTQRRYAGVLATAGLLDGSVGDLPGVDQLRAAVAKALPPKAAPQWTSSVEPWRRQLVGLLDGGLTAQAAFDRLRLETEGSTRPFVGSYSATKRFFRRVRQARGLRPEDVAIPVDTAPGEVAQVDLGYAGELYDPGSGVMRRAWFLVMVLGYSRLLFARITFDLTTEAWLDFHMKAFEKLQGVVETVVPDCTRMAVTRSAFGLDGPTELERSYRELAHHYGFKVDPAPPGEPRKKGKAESAVNYVKKSGLAARSHLTLDEAQVALARWTAEVANQRVHGTLRRRPSDVFEQEERAALMPLPTPCDPAVWKAARVHPDGHVAVRGRLLSVPWQLLHENVWVRTAGRTIAIFHKDRRVAVHPRLGPRRSTLEEHLPAERSLLRHRGRTFWEDRARGIGPETLGLVGDLFDSGEVLSQLRRVQAIVSHLERYPRDRAEATSRRVRASDDRSYRAVKDTLAQGLDLYRRDQRDGQYPDPTN